MAKCAIPVKIAHIFRASALSSEIKWYDTIKRKTNSITTIPFRISDDFNKKEEKSFRRLSEFS